MSWWFGVVGDEDVKWAAGGVIALELLRTRTSLFGTHVEASLHCVLPFKSVGAALSRRGPTAWVHP